MCDLFLNKHAILSCDPSLFFVPLTPPSRVEYPSLVGPHSPVESPSPASSRRGYTAPPDPPPRTAPPTDGPPGDWHDDKPSSLPEAAERLNMSASHVTYTP